MNKMKMPDQQDTQQVSAILREELFSIKLKTWQ